MSLLTIPMKMGSSEAFPGLDELRAPRGALFYFGLCNSSGGVTSSACAMRGEAEHVAGAHFIRARTV
jgi:hypothetical protein